MSIIDNAKDVVKLVQQVDNIELYRKILDLQAEVMQLVQENRELTEEIKSLREKFKFQGQVTFRDNAYWIEGDDIPFCSPCWEKDKQLYHLLDHGTGGYPYICPVCNTRVR